MMGCKKTAILWTGFMLLLGVAKRPAILFFFIDEIPIFWYNNDENRAFWWRALYVWPPHNENYVVQWLPCGLGMKRKPTLEDTSLLSGTIVIGLRESSRNKAYKRSERERMSSGSKRVRKWQRRSVLPNWTAIVSAGIHDGRRENIGLPSTGNHLPSFLWSSDRISGCGGCHPANGSYDGWPSVSTAGYKAASIWNR